MNFLSLLSTHSKEEAKKVIDDIAIAKKLADELAAQKIIDDFAVAKKIAEELAAQKVIDDGVQFLKMKGNETFKLAVNTLTKDVIEILEENGITSDDIDFLFRIRLILGS